MAYADQQMSGNKITALIIVALLHVAVGYALVTGLAYSAFKKIKDVTTAVKIEEEKPKEPPPPPPKQPDHPPPPQQIVAPPPPISLNVPAPVIQTVQTPQPPAPPAPVALPPAPPAPPAAPPAPPAAPPVPGTPRGNPGTWVTTNDYPSRALREERTGTTSFRLDYDASGRPSNCAITRSSGSPDLDQATCDNLMRRARFKPGSRDGQPVGGTFSSSVRWEIPKD